MTGTSDGIIIHGVTVHGTTVRGTMIHGTTLHGIMTHGTTIHGTTLHGITTHGTILLGTTVLGITHGHGTVHTIMTLITMATMVTGDITDADTDEATIMATSSTPEGRPAMSIQTGTIRPARTGGRSLAGLTVSV